MNKYFEKIDYETLLDLILDDAGYEEMVELKPWRANLLRNPDYKEYDDDIKKNFDNALSKGIVGNFWEQSSSNDTFRHMAVNRDFNDNHLRLYMCPEDQYLYFIVNETLKRAVREGVPLYLKYSRENRYDKIVMFIRNSKELKSITNLLETIKRDYPKMFLNMKKSPVWLSESKFKNAYIAPEEFTKRDYNIYFGSYTQTFCSMLNNIRKELMFNFKVNNLDDLKKVNKNDLLYAFKYYFTREICKMGLYLIFDENNDLTFATNDLFPGFGESVDEDIILTKNGLEIGKRIDDKNKRYYIIPFGSKVPTKLEDFKYFDSYVIDDETMLHKKLYPSLYDDIGQK